jgi:hypothetical protein
MCWQRRPWAVVLRDIVSHHQDKYSDSGAMIAVLLYQVTVAEPHLASAPFYA